MCLGGDHEVLGGEEAGPPSRMLWVSARVTQCNRGDKLIVIVNVFPLYFMKLQTSKQFDKCVCIMRCSNIMNLKS